VTLTRFERKIIAAILAVALLPFLGTVVLGWAALREAYQVGVNPRVEAELEGALATYRAHFVSLREGADRTADAVAFDARLSAAIVDADRAAIAAFVNEALERYDDVARITVEGPSGESWAGAERADRLDEGVYRHLRLARSSIGAPNVRIEVTVAAEAAPFVAYQRAGEVAEVYSRLEAGSAEVSGAYLAVYMGFLLTVMVVAVAVGVVASRRVTGRVADLAAATERVGAGDLTVSVPTHTSDEIGELTLAFNAMVVDLC
jgi:HAMP domain-containing protein